MILREGSHQKIWFLNLINMKMIYTGNFPSGPVCVHKGKIQKPCSRNGIRLLVIQLVGSPGFGSTRLNKACVKRALDIKWGLAS